MVRVGDTVSTNIDVLDKARSGDPGRVWVVAERQTGGRARRGREWTSDAGNLYASALLIDPCEPHHMPELPFVVVTAARRAVARAAGGRVDIGIKWPNDLLIRGHKVSGILLEATRTPQGRTAVAIGIGINCKHFPLGTETPATSLLAEGIDVFPERLFDDLAHELAEGPRRLGRGDAASKRVRDEWLAHALGLGRPIRVRLVEGEDEGLFEAIDAAGHLVLARADGTRRLVSAGDVFFRDPPGSEERR